MILSEKSRFNWLIVFLTSAFNENAIQYSICDHEFLLLNEAVNKAQIKLALMVTRF